MGGWADGRTDTQKRRHDLPARSNWMKLVQRNRQILTVKICVHHTSYKNEYRDWKFTDANFIVNQFQSPSTGARFRRKTLVWKCHIISGYKFQIFMSSLVCIMTRPCNGRFGFDTRQRQDFLTSPPCLDRSSGPLDLLSREYRGLFF
jgi:hypothetical protein